ncbi:MAG: hypothetical protein KDD02_00795, partial [Phaeodactylibacter sp.]|nr:hypothetical protein [Phaeodactylibacter sp.]
IPIPEPIPDPPPFEAFVPIPPRPFSFGNSIQPLARPLGGVQQQLSLQAAPNIELPQEVRLKLGNADTNQAR